MKIIAHIRSDFPSKFGIPRQSGLAPSLQAQIIFEPAYRNPDALRGLDGFSHIWLLWQFSEAIQETWSPMVRPPRLGGNHRVGVFASRSPFRPNPIGLSSVKLESILWDCPQAPVLLVSGADLMDGTPIYDIKPYISMDSHPEAICGYSDVHKDDRLEVEIPAKWLQLVPPEKRQALYEVLAHDPRPGYQNQPERVYGFYFAGLEVKFTVKETHLQVCWLGSVYQQS